MINIEKSVWDPKKDIEWLGFKIDLAKGEFSVPDHELVKLRLQLQETLGLQLMPARKLATLIENIISISLALGPVTLLMTHSLYATLNNRVAWCQK